MIRQQGEWLGGAVVTAALCTALLLGILQINSWSSRADGLWRDNRRSAGGSPAGAYASIEDQLLELLVPVPRFELPGWNETHAKYVAEIDEAKSKGPAGDPPWDVLVYGNSITETFRGTLVGADATFAYAANVAAWRELMLSRHSASVFAIAGDTPRFLLWRLLHGGGPSGLHPKAIAVEIGANDLAYQLVQMREDPHWVARALMPRTTTVLQELRRQAPDAHIVLHGLLPAAPAVPQPWSHLLPGSFVPYMAAANQVYAQHVASSGDARLHYADCGPLFLDEQGGLRYDLMPDGIHPGGERGGYVLLQCMMDAIELALQLDGG